MAAPRAQAFTLSNGLQVVVVPDHRVPVVTHMVWYRVGGADDPEGRSGLAHFLEHLMFKSTIHLRSGEFSRIVARLGGRENALTTHDTTSYFQRGAKSHLRSVMELEADRMANLRLVEAEVLTERDVVAEERRSSIEAVPLSLLSEEMLALLYANHPYRRPVLGWPHEIPQLSLGDAARFYKRHYAPNNAVLVVVGDVAAEEVRSLAEATYGHNRAQPEIRPRSRPQEPPLRAIRRIRLEDPRVGAPLLVRYYHAPNLVTARTGEAEAAAVLVQVLGANDTGRLHRRLVLERKVAVHAAAEYQAGGLDGGRIALLAVARDDLSLAAIEAAVDEVISEVRDQEIEARELARAKLALEAHRLFGTDSQLALATRYGEGVALGVPIKIIEETAQRLAQVSAADVRALARQRLTPQRSVTGTLIKSPVAP